MKETIFRLFVYGSLQQRLSFPAFQYISRYFRLEASGRIRGSLYDLGQFRRPSFAAMIILACGELYIIKDEAEFSYAIEQLDDYRVLL